MLLNFWELDQIFCSYLFNLRFAKRHGERNILMNIIFNQKRMSDIIKDEAQNNWITHRYIYHIQPKNCQNTSLTKQIHKRHATVEAQVIHNSTIILIFKGNLAREK